MRRLIYLLVILVLLLPARGMTQAKKPAEAQEATSGPMCPMMEKMKEQGQGMMQKDVVTWWQRGLMSQNLQQILNDSGQLLAGGALPDQARQQLAGVLRDAGKLIPEIFSPQGIQKPDEVNKKIADLKGTLAKIKAQAKP